MCVCCDFDNNYFTMGEIISVWGHVDRRSAALFSISALLFSVTVSILFYYTTLCSTLLCYVVLDFFCLHYPRTALFFLFFSHPFAPHLLPSSPPVSPPFSPNLLPSLLTSLLISSLLSSSPPASPPFSPYLLPSLLISSRLSSLLSSSPPLPLSSPLQANVFIPRQCYD
jgi:hypothetical protein